MIHSSQGLTSTKQYESKNRRVFGAKLNKKEVWCGSLRNSEDNDANLAGRMLFSATRPFIVPAAPPYPQAGRASTASTATRTMKGMGNFDQGNQDGPWFMQGLQ